MYDEALEQAKRLSDLNDDALFHELGLRVEDAKRPGGEERQLHFSAEFLAADPTMGAGVLSEIGHRWWRNLEPQLMQLVCDPNNKESRSSQVINRFRLWRRGLQFRHWPL